MATNIAGLSYRTPAVISFMKGVAASDQRSDDWSVELEREPADQHHATAIAVYGRWTERRKRWFRPEALEQRRVHTGYLNRDMADASLKRERHSRWPPNCMRSP
jgi:hypothetical protein